MPDPTSERRTIGILGGTFDPVHIGHIRLAIEAAELLNFHAVRFVPLNVPNHRAPPLVDGAVRFEMLAGALDGERLIADDRELVRGGTSYSFDTLTSLRAEFPAAPLCLLLGADAFHGLCSWHRWDELLDVGHLVVVDRPIAATPLDPRLEMLIDARGTADVADLNTAICGRIFFQPIPLLPISSTDIRARIAAGRDIRFLVPPSAERMVVAQQLYRT
jgi:nicotinate-nucleotide adenylyltransferase